MKNQIKITVTKENIKQGVVRDCYRCPIQRAIRDIGYCQTTVGREFVEIFSENSLHRYDLSRSARKFINNFDNRKFVKPQNFILKKIL